LKRHVESSKAVPNRSAVQEKHNPKTFLLLKKLHKVTTSRECFVPCNYHRTQLQVDRV